MNIESRFGRGINPDTEKEKIDFSRHVNKEVLTRMPDRIRKQIETDYDVEQIDASRVEQSIEHFFDKGHFSDFLEKMQNIAPEYNASLLLLNKEACFGSVGYGDEIFSIVMTLDDGGDEGSWFEFECSESETGEKMFYISSLFLRGEMMGKRIGSKTLENIESLLKGSGIDRIELFAMEDGSNFWAKKGFNFMYTEDHERVLRMISRKMDAKGAFTDIDLSTENFPTAESIANFEAVVDRNGKQISMTRFLYDIPWTGFKKIEK